MNSASAAPRPSPNPNDAAPIVYSAVVCTYNRSRSLGSALRSLLVQELPAPNIYEIVVIDNGSTDDTRAVVDRIASDAPDRIRYFREGSPGIAAARNRAVRESRGVWIAFMDDDETADPRWLLELASAADRSGTRVVGGSVHLRREPVPHDAPDEVRAYLSGAEIPASIRRIFGETEEGLPGTWRRGAAGPRMGNLLVHRSVFEELGDFDESLIEAGEDIDFFRRVREAGLQIWFAPSARIEHEVPYRRLKPDVLKAACRRIGWGFCRRDRRSRGIVGLAPLAAVRAFKLLLVTGPRAWIAWRRGRLADAMGHRVDVWRNAGYLECVGHQFAPGLVARIAPPPPTFRSEADMSRIRAVDADPCDGNRSSKEGPSAP